MKNVLELVKKLSLKDTKTLAEKGLKLSEECGELSANILSTTGASGSLHKFVEQKQLLTDSADVILVALSILYELGYDDTRIEDALMEKSLYWSSLQNYELSIDPWKLPHEIHVSIAETRDLDKFIHDCESMGVKPIILDLHSDRPHDIMTSSVYIGPSNVAIKMANDIADSLVAYGYTVIRKKVEVSPLHPACPRAINSNMFAAGNYFETHIEVAIDSTDPYQLRTLLAWADGRHELHVSSNYLKQNERHRVIMLTHRSASLRLEQFGEKVNSIRNDIEHAGFVIIGKPMIEFSLHDTNAMHDYSWLNA